MPAFVVVEIYVAFNSRYQAIVIRELTKVVHLALKSTPETFHWAVVNAAADTRHALFHSGIIQSDLEMLACILKTSVTMKQRVSIGVFRNGQIKGFKHELVIVASSHGERDNASVFEVKDCAQIQFFIISVLEFCDVGQPFLVKLFCCEITVQNILRCNFRSRPLVLRTLSADDGVQVNQSGKTIYTLVIVTGFVSGVQFICQSPISIYSVEFSVEITKLVKKIFVLILAGTLAAVEPFVIG